MRGVIVFGIDTGLSGGAFESRAGPMRSGAQADPVFSNRPWRGAAGRIHTRPAVGRSIGAIPRLDSRVAIGKVERKDRVIPR